MENNQKNITVDDIRHIPGLQDKSEEQLQEIVDSIIEFSWIVAELAIDKLYVEGQNS